MTVNRVVKELIESGHLRREGYKLFVGDYKEADFRPPVVHFLGPHDWITGHNQSLTTKVARRYKSHIQYVEWRDPTSYRLMLKELMAHGLNGLITFVPSLVIASDLFRELKSRQIPVILLKRDDDCAHSILCDHTKGWELVIKHHLKLGHREFAYFTEDDISNFNQHNNSENYRSACKNFGLAASAERISTFYSVHYEELERAFCQMRAQYPNVTCLCCHNDRIADILEKVILNHKLRVPEDYSLVGYWNSDITLQSDVHLTSVSENLPFMLQLAANMVFEQILLTQKTIIEPVFERIVVDPHLCVRASSGKSLKPPSSLPEPLLVHKKKTTAYEQFWLQSEEDRRQQIQSSWSQRYEPESTADRFDFTPVNLRNYFNRSTEKTYGWLTGRRPLKYLPSGRIWIHHILFKLEEESDSQQFNCIVLRSLKAKTSENAVLPNDIRIPLNETAFSIFFLHGCSFVARHEQIGTYELEYMDGKRVSLPIVTLGAVDGLTENEQKQREATANIQDWWPVKDHFSNKDAKHLILTQNGNPDGYLRYLYTLRWRNPCPRKTIKALILKARDDKPATLGILAITLCKQT